MNRNKDLVTIGPVLVSVLFLFIVLSGVVDQAEIQYETIRTPSLSHAEMASYVIRSEADWGDLWDKTHSEVFPAPPVPEIDFNSDMVIAVFFGVKNTGGFSITISRITETKSAIKVFVEETSPGPGCIVTQSLTSPYHIAKIRKSGKVVEFATKQTVNEC